MLKKGDAVSLWFIDNDPKHDWRPSTFRLDANLLKQDFSEAASIQLLGVALSAIRPATQENGRYLVVILKPVAERLHHLLEAPTGFTATQNADLEYALGRTLVVIGEQAGDNIALTNAINAYGAALEERTRERVPLDWARTQMNLGNALLRLGERESGTARLEEAVTAYRAALEEWTRERVPLYWAMSTGDQGVALKLIAERLNDVTKAQLAVQQIEVAFATMRDGGNAPAAAYYEAQLPKARSLLGRLTSRSQ